MTFVNEQDLKDLKEYERIQALHQKKREMGLQMYDVLRVVKGNLSGLDRDSLDIRSLSSVVSSVHMIENILLKVDES